MYKPLTITNHRRPPRQIFLLALLALSIVSIGYLRGFFGAHTTHVITFKSVTVVQQQNNNPPPSEPSPPLKAKEFGRPAVPVPPPPPKHNAKTHTTPGKHRFRSNGLVSVSPDPAASHPIPEIIAYAQRKWEGKLKRASKTLHHAVIEYERRYGRAPPLGFDKWWAYVEKHNVQLPDEYDQIYRDLEPFWGYTPEDLARIELDFEAHKDSYTLGKEAGGLIKMVNYSLPENNFGYHVDGAMSVIESLAGEGVEEFIPPFRAVFVPHDNPEHPFDWELRKVALGHASAGTHMDAFNPQVSMKYHGWISGCDPLSPAWRDPIDFTNPLPPPSPTSTKKSFIFDHHKAMDPCQHPSLFRHHGQFLSFHKGPIAKSFLVPSFSYSPSAMHQDITLAHTIAWRGEYNESEDCAWEEKWDERLEWRGKDTGIWAGGDHEWRSAHRARMAEWAARDLEGNLTLLNWIEGEGEEKFVTVSKARYAPAMLDIGFIDPPAQCAEDVCAALEKLYPYNSKRHSTAEAYKYKYILDVDGNGWSSRFHRLVSSRSLIFKSTVYPEWWLDRAQEWVHYVPVKGDYSDLWDALVWFRGGLGGEGRHEEEGRRIAEGGREWAGKYWRREDMTAYNFRLLLEYARVMSPDRTAMSYNHWDDEMR